MFLGEPSSETHVTTHPDGTTSTTVVTRESPWDDASRDAAYALYDDKLDRCPQCGRPIEECRTKDQDWHPQLDYCWRTAAETAANRQWLKRNDKAQPNEAGYLPTDGARVWVSPVDLDPNAPDFLSPMEELTEEALRATPGIAWDAADPTDPTTGGE